MCTVSFIYRGNKDFMLISNRDEAVNRKTTPPKQYEDNGISFVYPKDEVAGGTWIGASSKNRLLCLLNGAFVKHDRKSCYKKSRGVIVKELLEIDDVFIEINKYDFSGVEPFTLLIVDWNSELKLIELIWDGTNTQITDLPLEPKIWSSSTLYNSEMKEFRQRWFQEYLSQNGSSSEELLYFHEHYGVGDPMLDLKIDRGLLKTVSITMFEKNEEDIQVVYKDLLHDSISELMFNSMLMSDGK
ncbi:MAG: NRDE family protein [Flavobacteriaceae bacterium]|nr:NRDE family protein [Flavobacteriaceae bacterium]